MTLTCVTPIFRLCPFNFVKIRYVPFWSHLQKKNKVYKKVRGTPGKSSTWMISICIKLIPSIWRSEAGRSKRRRACTWTNNTMRTVWNPWSGQCSISSHTIFLGTTTKNRTRYACYYMICWWIWKSRTWKKNSFRKLITMELIDAVSCFLNIEGIWHVLS